MTPHDLIASFDVLAEAPNGVVRLRELVLELAVRGRLVPQDPDDEPASVLLAGVAKEKRRLVTEGRISRPKALPEVTERELPFAVPATWKWTRLAHAVAWDLVDGDWVESKDQDPMGAVRLTQLADVGVDAFLDKSDRFLTPETASRLNCTYLEQGDVLIARLPRPMGRACVFPGLPQPAVTVVDVAIARCGSAICHRFICHLLNSPYVREQTLARAAGTTRQRISTGNLRLHLVALPPFAEQKRIVARVDELMALLDRLEAARNARETTRIALRDAALAVLQNADTHEEVEVAWNRVAGRMHDLFTDPADVAPLRQTVLQLAVRGRLVRQTADEQADERSVLVRDVVDFLNGFAFKSEWYADNGVRVLRNQNVAHGTIDWTDERQVSATIAEEFARFALKEGDIVLSLDRPLISTGLKVARIGRRDLPSLLLQRVACPRFRRYGNLLADYFFIWLNSPSFTESIDPGRSNGVPHISTREVEKMEFRLPAQTEQRRIVARVDQLMALLDRLERQLADQTGAHDAFAAAAVQRLGARAADETRVNP